MESIQFRGTDSAFMRSLSIRLAAKLQKAWLSEDLQVGPTVIQSQSEATRGDPVTWMTVALTAVGAGGAMSVLLGKDGCFSALARLLEKDVEGRQAEVLIETNKGEKITITGPVGVIKAILEASAGLVPR
ncbi:MAG: hypothetical protein ACRERS_03550 [Methylococcales bacterium]